MRGALQSTFGKVVFFAVAATLMALYLFMVGRSFRAAQLSSKLEEGSLRTAALLEPGDADYAHALGRYRFLTQDAQAATPELERAVNLNPFVARFWLDLAAAYYVQGNLQGQQHAISQSVTFDPRSPDTAWEAANFYLAEGRTDEALQQLAVVLHNTSEPLTPALQLTWRTTQDIGQVLSITPNQTQALLALLQLMINNNRVAEAQAVWQRLAALRQPLDPKQLAPWIKFLISQKRPDEASAVWQQSVALNPDLRAYSSPDNLVFNGDFEHDLLDAGFDWQFPSTTDLSFALDPTQLHGGTRSLRITFPGSQTQDTGLWQWVAVHPNTTYAFSAFVRSEELLTGSGPRFEIIDPYSGQRLLLTDDLLGTNSWMQIRGDFHAGPDCRLIALRIVRVPAEGLIKGQMWIDDVSITQP